MRIIIFLILYIGLSLTAAILFFGAMLDVLPKEYGYIGMLLAICVILIAMVEA